MKNICRSKGGYMITEIHGRKYEFIFKDDCIELYELKLVTDSDSKLYNTEKRERVGFFSNLEAIYKSIVLRSLSKKNGRIKSFEDVLIIIKQTNEQFRSAMRL